MCRLTAEGVRLSRSAARAKVPWRAMVTKVRRAFRDMRLRSGSQLTEAYCQSRPSRSTRLLPGLADTAQRLLRP
ncbi:hypothetical protein D3C75_1213230 [compost metagenome]